MTDDLDREGAPPTDVGAADGTDIEQALRDLVTEIGKDRQSAADRSVAILSEVRDLAATQHEHDQRLAAIREEWTSSVAATVGDLLETARQGLREDLDRFEARIHASVDDRLQVLLDDRLGRLEDTIADARGPGAPTQALQLQGEAGELRAVMEEQLTLMRTMLRDELDRLLEQEERLLGRAVAEFGSRVGSAPSGTADQAATQHGGGGDL